MALRKGWLSGIMGQTLGRGIGESVEGTAKAMGIDLIELPSRKDMEILDLPDIMVKGYSSLGGILGAPLGLFPFLATFFSAGAGTLAEQQAARVYETERLPVNIFTRLSYRKDWTSEQELEWRRDLYDQGFNDARIDAMLKANEVLLSTGEIRELYLRGQFGEGDTAKTEALARMTKLGISADDASKLFEIFFFIPPPQDLVNWSAKEVFEKDAIEKYGLDDEFEKLDLTLFAKAGVSPEQARNYWRAHWQHPGLNTIQELLHRTEFSEADFWEWFKLVEIPPYWREKLIKIAYNPFTRVDIRRMYREGILNEVEVNAAYHEIGSDDWHADKLTKWTVKYYAPEDTGEDKEVRELTKAEILRGYEDKVIPRNMAIEGLMGIDYSAAGAEFLVLLRDVKVFEAETKEALTYIGGAYKLGLLTESEMIGKLGQLDLTGEQQDYYVEKFRRTDTQKVIVPTLATFKRWLKLEIVTIADFRSYVTKRGYSLEHIEHFVAEVNASERGELPSGE